MEPIALSRASELIQVSDSLDRLGFSADRLLGQAGLPLWQYCAPDDLIPKHHIFAFMEHAARSIGSPTFGLRVGAQTNLSSMGSFGSLISCSLTTFHALTMSCRLIHLHNFGAQLSLVAAGGEIWFRHRETPNPSIGRWQKEQYVVMRMIDHVRLTAGPCWHPDKVFLQRRAAPEPELREALRDPEIRVGQDFTGIALPRALLALPLRRREMPVGDRQAMQRRIRQTAPATSFVGSLRHLAGTLMKEGLPQIDTMAEITGLSVRTLQRQLAKNGLSHSELVDQARYQAATRLLRDADIRITDIAMELNYTDSANFTRAFKRWAGVTPREYRSQQLAK